MINWFKDRYWPMEYVEFDFIDIVSGNSVNRYRTAGTGQIVMAESRWSFFRVPSSKGVK
jgi:hypothetical protein